jgi:hypothetical protein
MISLLIEVDVRFDVFTAITMKNAVFWGISTVADTMMEIPLQ